MDEEKKEVVVKKKATPKKEEPKITYDAYCSIKKVNSGVRFTAKMKFGKFPKKTQKEWDKIFKENRILG